MEGVDMEKVVIYSKENCSYCVMAKKLLEHKGCKYLEIRVDYDEEQLKKMIEITSRRTVPQIFIGEKYIGGFDDLSALNEKGELDQLLGIN